MKILGNSLSAVDTSSLPELAQPSVSSLPESSLSAASSSSNDQETPTLESSHSLSSSVFTPTSIAKTISVSSSKASSSGLDSDTNADHFLSHEASHDQAFVRPFSDEPRAAPNHQRISSHNGAQLPGNKVLKYINYLKFKSSVPLISFETISCQAR